jgi:DNA processing protein
VTSSPVQLTPLDPAYPSRLRGVPEAPASLTTCGGSLEAERVVAIVGSRQATPAAADFARDLAATLADRGIVVVSGGALGIDGAAHRGALSAGGRTWVVAPTGFGAVFPEAHARLFEEVARGPGAMVWPFAPDYRHRTAFLARNRVLVALADAVVVVQAGFPSGALRAAAVARTLGRALWVVPAPPWLDAFRGSRMLLAEPGARPLLFVDAFLATLGAPPAAPQPRPPPGPLLPSRPLNPSETDALRVTSSVPLHLDEIASRAGLSAPAAAAALLTLALENVVVEGPPGFFTRRNAG